MANLDTENASSWAEQAWNIFKTATLPLARQIPESDVAQLASSGVQRSKTVCTQEVQNLVAGATEQFEEKRQAVQHLLKEATNRFQQLGEQGKKTAEQLSSAVKESGEAIARGYKATMQEIFEETQFGINTLRNTRAYQEAKASVLKEISDAEKHDAFTIPEQDKFEKTLQKFESQFSELLEQNATASKTRAEIREAISDLFVETKLELKQIYHNAGTANYWAQRADRIGAIESIDYLTGTTIPVTTGVAEAQATTYVFESAVSQQLSQVADRIEELSLRQLKAIAKAIGRDSQDIKISGYGDMTKAQLAEELKKPERLAYLDQHQQLMDQQ